MTKRRDEEIWRALGQVPASNLSYWLIDARAEVSNAAAADDDDDD